MALDRPVMFTLYLKVIYLSLFFLLKYSGFPHLELLSAVGKKVKETAEETSQVSADNLNMVTVLSLPWNFWNSIVLPFCP